MVWNEYLVLAMIEVVLKAVPEKEFVLIMLQGVLRAFFDGGLIWHTRFLIASLTDFVKSCDDPVCQTSVDIEIALGLGHTKMMGQVADSSDMIASEDLLEFHWTLGRCVNL